MRVTLCIDALAPDPSGIGRYTWELSQGLPRAGIQPLYFGRGRRIADPQRLLTRAPLPVARRGTRKLRKWWDHRALKSGLVHGPNYFLPSFAEQGVITVHDLSVLRYPATHPLERIKAFEREFEASLRRAVHVITDSETVRQEVIADLGWSPDRVTAVHLGVDPVFRPRTAAELQRELESLGLVPGRYGLCVSTLEPRKKIDVLVDAWSRLPVRLRMSYPLALAGGGGWRNEELLACIERGVSEGWLRTLGYVPEPMLPMLYAGAAVFAYPSLYEGFGLPPLEALASGVPAVISDRSCLPEVCGSVPLYVDPDDAAAMAHALERALTDAEWRASAAASGIAHAASFTWERCVAATANIYRIAASSHSAGQPHLAGSPASHPLPEECSIV